MRPFRLLPFLLLSLLFFENCEQKPRQAVQPAAPLPKDSQPTQVSLSDLNCWTEQGRFFVTGICSNQSDAWQKIWLRLELLNAGGKQVAIAGANAVVVPLFSGAVPPRGRSSFFAFWPLSNFSQPPDSFRLLDAVAVSKPSGPVLIAEEVSGVKILVPGKTGDPASGEEKGWQINGVLHNPLPLIAHHPFLELLLYGSDGRLWFSTLLDSQDPQQKQFLFFERAGAMISGEKRPFRVAVFYERLPQMLKDKKIGRAEILPFEAR